MKPIVKKFISLAGYTLSVGLSLLLFGTFLVAYFNDYRVLVVVNHYNEAHIELITFPIVIGVCIVGLYYLWKDIYKS